MIEAQELYCHNCNNYVQFSLDLSIDDNYLLKCKKCNHKHFRMVKNGKITDLRWGMDPSQIAWSILLTVGSTARSSFTTYRGANYFLYESWSTSVAT